MVVVSQEACAALCAETVLGRQRHKEVNAKECGLELKGAREREGGIGREIGKAAHQTDAIGFDNREPAGH